jgi:hypothetical protein
MGWTLLMGPALAGLLLSFTKLPLLLTPLTYIHVGDAEIDHFGRNAFIHELIRGSLGYGWRKPRL